MYGCRIVLSVHTSPEPVPGALAGLQARAGAVFARRRGRPVAVSYGSAAGELAACLRAVGMADSSQLTKLELCGPARPLGELVRLATGGTLAPGGVLEAGGTWWCGADGPSRTFTTQRVFVLGEPELGERLRALLRARAARLPGLAVRRPQPRLGCDHRRRRRHQPCARPARRVWTDRRPAPRAAVHHLDPGRRRGDVAAAVRASGRWPWFRAPGPARPGTRSSAPDGPQQICCVGPGRDRTLRAAGTSRRAAPGTEPRAQSNAR